MSNNSLNQEWFNFPGTKDNYRTMVYYPGTGGSTFEFNFEGGYINQQDIKAFMVKDDTRDIEYLTLTFKGPNTVQTNKPVPKGWTICIFRDTPKAEPLAKYQDGAVITAENLDRNAQQAMFAVSEMVDRFDSTVSQVDIALKAVYEATQTADAALAEAKKATGIAQGAVVTADDAKATANAATSTANAASQRAEQAAQTAIDAKNTANNLDGQIKSANDTAQAANQTAADAKRIAEGVDGKATQAQSDAAAAVKTATEAKQIANSIDAKATQAQKDAAEAIRKANEVEQSVGTVQELSNRVKDFKSNDGVEWKGSHTFNTRVALKRSTSEYGYVDVQPTYTSLNHGANSDVGEFRVGRNVFQYNGNRVAHEGITDFRYGNTLVVQSASQPGIYLNDTTRGTQAVWFQNTDGRPVLQWKEGGAIKGELYVPSGTGTAVATQHLTPSLDWSGSNTELKSRSDKPLRLVVRGDDTMSLYSTNAGKDLMKVHASGAAYFSGNVVTQALNFQIQKNGGYPIIEMGINQGSTTPHYAWQKQAGAPWRLLYYPDAGGTFATQEWVKSDSARQLGPEWRYYVTQGEDMDQVWNLMAALAKVPKNAVFTRLERDNQWTCRFYCRTLAY